MTCSHPAFNQATNRCVDCNRTMAEIREEPRDYRRVRPQPGDIPKVEGPSAEERKQSKADMRVVHLLEKMGEAHANFMYHQERAAHYHQVGQELNAKIVKIVHALSEKFRVIPADDDDRKTETRAPQNIEEFIEAMFGRMK